MTNNQLTDDGLSLLISKLDKALAECINHGFTDSAEEYADMINALRELQEHRKASAYPIPFDEFDKIRFALIDRITEGMSVDDCHSAIDDVLGECEWRYSHEPGVLCQCDECRAKREGNKS